MNIELLKESLNRLNDFPEPGSFPHSIKKKICKVANINQEIFRVIEKPILETIL